MTRRSTLFLTAFLIALFFVTALFAGCGGDKSTEGEDLKTFTNNVNLQIDKPMTPASVTGTIIAESTEKEPNRAFVKIKVDKFELMSNPTSEKTGANLAPGTEIVVEVINPKSDFPEGKKIAATLRISKMQGGGFKIIAENARLI